MRNWAPCAGTLVVWPASILSRLRERFMIRPLQTLGLNLRAIMPNSFTVCRLLIAVPFLLHGSVLNSAQSSPVQTTSPFTVAEKAVYHAFLAEHFPGNSHQEPIAVSELTMILQPDEGDYSGCMKGLPQDAPPKIIRRLTEEFAKGN